MSNGFFFKKSGSINDKLRDGDSKTEDSTPKTPVSHSEGTRVVYDQSDVFHSQEELEAKLPEGHTKYVHVVVTTEDGKKVLHDCVANGCFMIVLSDKVTDEQRELGCGDKYLEAFAHSIVSTEELGGMLEGTFALIKQVVGNDPMKQMIVKIAAERSGVMFVPMSSDDAAKSLGLPTPSSLFGNLFGGKKKPTPSSPEDLDRITGDLDRLIASLRKLSGKDEDDDNSAN